MSSPTFDDGISTDLSRERATPDSGEVLPALHAVIVLLLLATCDLIVNLP